MNVKYISLAPVTEFFLQPTTRYKSDINDSQEEVQIHLSDCTVHLCPVLPATSNKPNRTSIAPCPLTHKHHRVHLSNGVKGHYHMKKTHKEMKGMRVLGIEDESWTKIQTHDETIQYTWRLKPHPSNYRGTRNQAVFQSSLCLWTAVL